MKLACVVQRYGPDIVGGSETHCRQLAQRLSAAHEVDVLTTTARDYLQWRNDHREGWTGDGPVRVRRFRVVRPRRHGHLADITEQVLDREPSEDVQRAWFTANGPEVPDLLAHLDAHGRDYDLVLFWTFRYYPSFFGLPIVSDRAVLIPTAEEDGILDLPILGSFFARPRGLMFLTPEERQLVSDRTRGPLPPSTVIGTGLEPPPRAPQAAVNIPGEPFLLYLGRVDPNKGCDVLFRHYLRAASEGVDLLPLVVAGPLGMPVPTHPLIRVLGYVSDDTREALLASARALVMPSPYESLSIAVLEAWNHGRPALVNGRCAVLRGQVRRANAGLAYGTYHQFVEALALLAERPGVADQLGRQGRDYADLHYRWPIVMERVERFLADLMPTR